MFLNLLVALASVVAATAIPTPASASLDLGQVYLKSIAYDGTGCPQDSVDSYISADKQSFVLSFDSYVASIGPNISIAESRKNCQLNLNVQYPIGFQYSIQSTVFRGYIGIEKGITATQSAIYYFSGQTLQSKASTVFVGPQETDYKITDLSSPASVIWSPCGAPVSLNIGSAILLRSSVPRAVGEMTNDSINGKITFITGIQWRKC